MNEFKELGLGENILKGIAEIGFESPTTIQAKVIKTLIDNREDLIGLAQTGTGKTAAFGLPILETIDTSNRNIQNLILSPTRELCIQIAKNLKDYAKYIDGAKVLAVYGGENITIQLAGLRNNPQILVATPGRILDLCNRKKVDLSHISTLILDEADEMLNMGFKEDLDSIINLTPEDRRTLLFSATMPKEVDRISKKYLKNPIEITDGKKNTGATNVSHEYHITKAENRYKTLKRVIDNNPGIYSIVFCRTRHETKDVAKFLIQDGYNAEALHGDLTQVARDSVMHKFRTKTVQLLVATDVASRGLDVSDLTHVINYNLPDDNESYTHRSGRTGRAGKKGVSISLIHLREKHKIRDIERKIKVNFVQKPIPVGPEICKRQFFNFIDRLQKVEVNTEQINPLLDDIYKKLEWMNREQLITNIVSLEFNRFLTYYENAPDLNVIDKPGSRDYDDNGRGRSRDRRDRGGDRRDRDNRGGDRDNSRGDRRVRGDRRERDSERGERGSRSDRRDRGDNSERGEKKFNKSGERKTSANSTRFFLNKGTNQEFNPAKILGVFNDAVGVRSISVNNIDVMKKFSFFEVESKYKDLVLEAFDKKLKSKGINIEIANKKNSKGL